MPPTLLFDRSDRARLTFSGTHAVTTLNGLLTNDVAALVPGMGAYAAVLTPKGKIVADLRIFALEDRWLVDTSTRAALNLRATFTKYVNPRFATMTDASETFRDLGIFGDRARDIVSSFTGVPTDVLTALPLYAHVTAEGVYGSIIVARSPDLHVEGYELFVHPTHASTVSHALTIAGAQPGTAEMWHTRRVAAGRPAWGIDMDDTTLPQEANFDALQGISYTKGCYVGQETVARIHFRGHVNRTLRRLRIGGPINITLLQDAEVSHETEPPHGTTLLGPAPDSTTVGDIRSVARQADGTLLAIGMVRREFEAGIELSAQWETMTCPVHILGAASGVGG